MNSFKMTKRNILMIKDMAACFDKVREIAFSELDDVPFPEFKKLQEIREIYEKFGKDWGNG